MNSDISVDLNITTSHKNNKMSTKRSSVSDNAPPKRKRKKTALDELQVRKNMRNTVNYDI